MAKIKKSEVFTWAFDNELTYANRARLIVSVMCTDSHNLCFPMSLFSWKYVLDKGQDNLWTIWTQ